jgi:GNAT superfamily N-acetyltransferase
VSSPTEGSPHRLELFPLTFEDGRPLQALFAADPDYFETFHGHPPGAEAQSTFSAIPEGKSYEDKELWGAFEGSALVGVVDAIAHYPDVGCWTIGIVFVPPEWRRRSIGRALVEHIEMLATERRGQVVRAGVQPTNQGALHFFAVLGYEQRGEQRTTDRLILTRNLVG